MRNIIASLYSTAVKNVRLARTILPLYFLLPVIILSGCMGEDSAFDSHEEITLKDVAYGDDPLNTMDLHLPAMRTTKTKVVVFIHGGGWKEGSKEQFDPFIGQFVAAGLATVSINYRHANVDEGILYTELLEDIDKALLYLRSESGNYIFNGNDVTLFGHSAGAHLALLYAYRNNERKQVKSVISLSAPTNLRALVEAGTFPALLYNLVGSDLPLKYADASPITHVKSGAIRAYIFHGKADESVPYKQAQEFYNVLSRYTPYGRLKIVDGVGHEFSESTYPLIINESISFAKN
jgi:acetyl esterase/lipase